jgi:DNA-binding CsgD family transcriptional regulator
LRARALADRAMLGILAGSAACLDWAQEALALAREVDDPALLVRALAACGYIASYFDAEPARAYFAEAIGPARELGDPWRLTPILAAQAFALGAAGNPLASRAAAEEGRDLAEAIGDRLNARRCRMYLGRAQLYQGDLAAAAAQFAAAGDEAEAPRDEFFRTDSRAMLGWALAYQGDTAAARAAADAAVEAAAEVGGVLAGLAYWALAVAALAAGDAATALDATEKAGQHMSSSPQTAAVGHVNTAQAALAGGDLVAARRFADDAASTATGMFLSEALTVRARVAIAQDEPDGAERDAHDALAGAAEVGAYMCIPDILECLGTLASEADSHREAARLLGAATAIRQRMGAVRFKVWDVWYEASVATLRDALGDKDFDSAWAEGAGLSIDEAIAYAQRGRGQRKRPSSGWGSLTPTERDVVQLVSEGLANNDIATRLFISPRTVQTHLTHVYTKLGLTSRVQLAQEATRRT